MLSRKQSVAILTAVILSAAVLVTFAILLALQQRKAVVASAQREPERKAVAPTTQGEVRIYGGLPKPDGFPLLVLTNAGYLTGYSETRRNPVWVSFSVGSITLGNTAKRQARFLTDTRTANRVSHDDYTGSGYDRGHLAPNYAIGTRYGAEAQRETFYLSNIVPQSPNLNRIWWRLLEEKEANDFAVRLERVWIITGPVFGDNPQKLRGGVEIPVACYRIILDEENGQPRTLAFIVPQTVTGHEPFAEFLTSVREVESKTHLDFFPELPREVQERMESGKAARVW